MTPEEIGARFVALLAGATAGTVAGTVAAVETGPGTGARAGAGAEAGTRAGAAAGIAAGAGTAVEAGAGTAVEAGAGTAVEAGGEPAARRAVEHSRSGGGQWARATVDVPLPAWQTAFWVGRDDAELALDFFDWLSAVDDLDAGFTLVAHLWSTVRRHGVLLRTRITNRAAPAAGSVVSVYPGAAWHERETHEMFGIDFPGHKAGGAGELRPLLLPPEFEGHPLRKEFVLATRVAKPWPGAKEPGESEHAASRRQPMRPPGVPDPREWGPDAGAAEAEPPPARPARAARTARPAGSARPTGGSRPTGAAGAAGGPGAAGAAGGSGAAGAAGGSAGADTPAAEPPAGEG